MNEQQLMKTIEDQNQVIVAKDATIELLRKQLGDAKSELNELYLDRSWQEMQREYLTEAIWQKLVKIIGGFEYVTLSSCMKIMGCNMGVATTELDNPEKFPCTSIIKVF